MKGGKEEGPGREVLKSFLSPARNPVVDSEYSYRASHKVLLLSLWMKNGLGKAALEIVPALGSGRSREGQGGTSLILIP